MSGGAGVGLAPDCSPAVEDVAGELLAEVVQDEALHVEIQRLVDSGREHRRDGAVGVVGQLVVLIIFFIFF